MIRPKPRYQPGDRIADRYEVHDVKMGGMGEVYFCLDLKEDYPFALKTFQQRYQLNEKLRQAFENEVGTWVALEKHPNIVRCFWMDTLDNRPFMFLEWIVGDERDRTDLRSWLRHGPLDFRLALDFTIDICRGLIHAQQKQSGIVHRDLKPENILIAQGQLAKITDFGLAQVVYEAGLEIPDTTGQIDRRQSLIGQGGIVGTPAYMSPEQWRGKVLDVRTDIYAVGCILYEMLTGEWPFQAATSHGLRRLHLEGEIPKLAGRELPQTLDTLLAHCLAKRRHDRFSTVNDLLEQLGQIYQGEFAMPPQVTLNTDQFTPTAYSNRAATYHQLQRYDEALADYARAIELDPTDAIAYVNRAVTYHKLQRFEEALNDHDRACQLNPNLGLIYTNRALVYEELERYENALADYEQAIQIDPINEKIYFSRGNMYVRSQRYEEALADFNRFIELDPTSAQAYTYRASVYERLERYEDALADYDQAIQLDPADAIPYDARATIYSGSKQYKKAFKDYNQAIQLDPTNTAIYVNRGATYSDVQLYREALADYDRAIALDPTLARAYYNRGHVYFKLQQYQNALADYNQAVALDPELAAAYSNRGDVHAVLQRYEQALADYTEAIQLAPTLATAYYNRGNLNYELQRYEQALADQNQAIQLDPTLPEAYANRGNIYAALEEFDKALSDYNQAIQLDPNYAVGYFNIGAALSNLNKLREALTYFEKATQLGHPQGEQHIILVEQLLGLEVFEEAGSIDELRHAMAEFPFMLNMAYVEAIKQAIIQYIPQEQQPIFDQRLAWLRQITTGTSE